MLISGMPGSGKSEAASVLKEMGVLVLSMGDVVRYNYEKYKKANESLLEFALRIRREKGKGVVAELTLEFLKGSDVKIVGIEGVRSIEEVEVFRRFSKEIVLISIHAPPYLRYRRILSRYREDDPKVLDEIIRRDFKELELGIGSVIAMSDYIIVNDKDLESFKRKCRELFEMIIYGKNNSESRA
ncbi:MAG: AAA family ATPase [Sulfolobaceae archaeon]